MCWLHTSSAKPSWGGYEDARLTHHPTIRDLTLTWTEDRAGQHHAEALSLGKPRFSPGPLTGCVTWNKLGHLLTGVPIGQMMLAKMPTSQAVVTMQGARCIALNKYLLNT